MKFSPNSAFYCMPQTHGDALIANLPDLSKDQVDWWLHYEHIKDVIVVYTNSYAAYEGWDYTTSVQRNRLLIEDPFNLKLFYPELLI